MKPAQICSPWCHVAKAGLGSALGPVRDGPFASVFQVSLEQKSHLLRCSVASAAPEFAGVLFYRYSMGYGFGASMCVFLLCHLGSAPLA